MEGQSSRESICGLRLGLPARLGRGRLFARVSTGNGGEAFVATDEQASRTHGVGLSLEELQGQRTELLPDRPEMARRRRRRGNRCPGVNCIMAIGAYPDPDHPCNNPQSGRF